MGDWVGRDKFKADVDEYQESTGKVQEEVAKSLGVVLTYFRQVLYGSKKPSTKLLRKAASLFGTELISYLADPGAKIVGQDVKGLNAKEQVWADMLFTKFKDPNLDEYDRQMLFEDWTKDYDRIKSQKLRSKNIKTGGSDDRNTL